ncbi:hypothetical protein M3Y96_01180300 [Aphelenchoides besseyi]|nr:hypothetical protein M3Y96_01180300 [Aphelenchoides besseyi]
MIDICYSIVALIFVRFCTIPICYCVRKKKKTPAAAPRILATSVKGVPSQKTTPTTSNFLISAPSKEPFVIRTEITQEETEKTQDTTPIPEKPTTKTRMSKP